ncbi:uncharacterized protein LOC117927620 isoform X1 [Vitis riparia]|nr:uncharacterized protein LOC117927620 isoform X1 [Vitis riparia]
MLQLFFAVAFSSVPLTLYIPPLRSLNLFVETMEDIVRETSMHTDRLYPRVRQAFFRILDCMLCNNMRFLCIIQNLKVWGLHSLFHCFFFY